MGVFKVKSILTVASELRVKAETMEEAASRVIDKAEEERLDWESPFIIVDGTRLARHELEVRS